MRGGDIKKVSDLFLKYKERLIAPESSVTNAFVEVVEDLMGVKVSVDRVKYTPSSRTLSLNLPATLKSEIKLNEKEIISHLKGRIGVKNAPKTIL